MGKASPKCPGTHTGSDTNPLMRPAAVTPNLVWSKTVVDILDALPPHVRQSFEHSTCAQPALSSGVVPAVHATASSRQSARQTRFCTLRCRELAAQMSRARCMALHALGLGPAALGLPAGPTSGSASKTRRDRASS